MIIPIYTSDEEGEAVKLLLDGLARDHGLVSARSGSPSRSEAARAVLGAHDGLGFLLLPNTAVTHVITKDAHGRVTLHLPDNATNRARLDSLEAAHGGETTAERGWLSYAGNLDEADCLQWLSAQG